jgi:hypothetical protein
MFLSEYPEHRQQHDGFVGRESRRQKEFADIADVVFAQVHNKGAARNLLYAVKYPAILPLGVVRLRCEALVAEIFLDDGTKGIRPERDVVDLSVIDVFAP